MNKNFNKEYIKECKAEEIQIIRRQIRYEEGLSYQQFYEGDYRYYEDAPQKDNIVLVKKDELWQVNVHYWLPTGDQLDEEIIKICRYYSYRYDFIHSMDGYEVFIHNDLAPYQERKYYFSEPLSGNPLIAKIKLLKELLK